MLTFLEYLNESKKLVCEGGASGHLGHVFEQPNLTFKQIKDIFSKVFSGKLQLTEKCLSPTSKVQLKEHGEKTISEVVDKHIIDDILSYNEDTNSVEYCPIIGWSNNDTTDKWLKITLDDGTELICTPNHRLWCDTLKSDVKAEDLQIGDELLTVV